MRAIVLSIIGLFTPFLAQAQLLTFEEILENIEGVWAIPYGIEETGATDFRCDQSPLQIRVFKENGQLFYESEILGHGHIAKSEIYVWEMPDGAVAPYLLLQYEDEARTTDDGVLVQWRLLMTDPDTFYWQRTDWEASSTTAPRKRCEASPGIS